MGWTAHAPTRTAANEAWWNLFGPSFEGRLMTRSLTRAQDDPISAPRRTPHWVDHGHDDNANEDAGTICRPTLVPTTAGVRDDVRGGVSGECGKAAVQGALRLGPDRNAGPG
jgi:hypothetical protein